MKRKYLAIALGLAMTMTLLSGCGSADSTATSSESVSTSSTTEAGTEKTGSDLAGQTISGEITAIDGNTVTVDGQSFEVTDDTTITRQMGDMNMNGQGGEAPEKPSEDADTGNADASGDTQTPPEMPSGEADAGSADVSDGSQTPPEKPSEEADTGSTDASGDTQTSPEKPSGEAPSDEGGQGDFDPNAELTIDDLQVGDEVEVTFDEEGNAASIVIQGGDMGGQGGGQSSGVDSYTAVVEYTEDTDVSNETYESTGTDENAIHVSNKATVTLDGITVERNSDSSTGGDNSSFYGVGAAVLNTDGTLNISNATITTDAKGGAGVFSYGDGVTYVSDSTITTTQDTSGGIHVAGGGTLHAENLTVETSGESSAAIRSDRGGGTMTVDGGSYTSNGKGSPAVYCTADISVSDADLTANGSEAVCIEGLNSLSLTDCNLTGNMPDDNDQNDCTWNVILYQSMSGDSEVGNSTFTMTGGTLTANNGGMFYTTNTESTITLENVDITYADENDFFLKCTGNSNARGWGNSGNNGADCTFTGINQKMEGDVIWDSISGLDFSLTKGSTLTGAILDDETNAGNGGSGYCNVTIDKDSTWIVTGDSTLTKLVNAGTIKDADGKTVTVKGTDGTVYVQGTSSYTITVDSYEG